MSEEEPFDTKRVYVAIDAAMQQEGELNRSTAILRSEVRNLCRALEHEQDRVSQLRRLLETEQLAKGELEQQLKKVQTLLARWEARDAQVTKL